MCKYDIIKKTNLKSIDVQQSLRINERKSVQIINWTLGLKKIKLDLNVTWEKNKNRTFL